MKILDPENMVKVRAVTPLELGRALHLWGEATVAMKRGAAPHPLIESTGPVDPTEHELQHGEKLDYSNRVAAGLFEWLKEV